MLALGRPPRCDPPVRSAGGGSVACEFLRLQDHEMDGAFAGRPRCDPKCGQRVGAVSPDVGDDRCFENTGDDEFSSAGAGGWRTVSSSRSMKRCSSSTSARDVCWAEDDVFSAEEVFFIDSLRVFDELVVGGRFRLLCR